MIKLWTITDENGRFALVAASDTEEAYDFLPEGWPPEWQLDFACIGVASQWIPPQLIRSFNA